MADGVDTDMHTMESPVVQSVLDRVGAHAELEKLPARDDAVLLPGQVRHPPIDWLLLTVHAAVQGVHFAHGPQDGARGRASQHPRVKEVREVWLTRRAGVACRVAKMRIP
jgi:hypothetical protein